MNVGEMATYRYLVAPGLLACSRVKVVAIYSYNGTASIKYLNKAKAGKEEVVDIRALSNWGMK